MRFFGAGGVGVGGGVGGRGKGVSLVMLLVQRKSSCNYLTGVKMQ